MNTLNGTELYTYNGLDGNYYDMCLIPQLKKIRKGSIMVEVVALPVIHRLL